MVPCKIEIRLRKELSASAKKADHNWTLLPRRSAHNYSVILPVVSSTSVSHIPILNISLFGIMSSIEFYKNLLLQKVSKMKPLSPTR